MCLESLWRERVRSLIIDPDHLSWLLWMRRRSSSMSSTPIPPGSFSPSFCPHFRWSSFLHLVCNLAMSHMMAIDDESQTFNATNQTCVINVDRSLILLIDNIPELLLKQRLTQNLGWCGESFFLGKIMQLLPFMCTVLGKFDHWQYV